jgi:hypothetical protein
MVAGRRGKGAGTCRWGCGRPERAARSPRTIHAEDRGGGNVGTWV